MENKKTNIFSYIGLFAVVFIWGIGPNIYNLVLNFYSPAFLSGIISLCCTLILVLFNYKDFKKIPKSYFKVAIPTGLFYSAACLLQRIGINYTTPAKYAFLENLSCLVVPFLVAFFVKQKPPVIKTISAFLCLFGMFILSGINGGEISLGKGEILCGLAGIFFGVNIAGTAVYARKLKATIYITIQFAIQAIMSFIYAFSAENIKYTFAPHIIGLIIFIILIENIFCWIVRTNVLKHLDPTFVAVVMPFSAIITGIVSILLGTDILTLPFGIGAVIVLVAVILSGI